MRLGEGWVTVMVHQVGWAIFKLRRGPSNPLNQNSSLSGGLCLIDKFRLAACRKGKASIFGIPFRGYK